MSGDQPQKQGMGRKLVLLSLTLVVGIGAFLCWRYGDGFQADADQVTPTARRSAVASSPPNLTPEGQDRPGLPQPGAVPAASSLPDSYPAADFRLALYGNPYKAVIDAQALAPGRRDSVYVRVYMLCIRAHRLVKGERYARGIPGDVGEAAAVSQALIALEAQCAPIWQDEDLLVKIQETTSAMLRARDQVEETRQKGGSLREAPLDAWADLLAAQPGRDGGRAEAKYFQQRLWGGLETRELYNRAVQQALIDVTITPGIASPHLESIYHCAYARACGIPAGQVAIHNLPEPERSRVQAVAQAMQLDIAAGNYRAFELPARP